jgi:hypothetical protein
MEQVRNDRLLLSRYPTLAAHDQARQRALESTQKAIDTIQVRIAQLETERVVLANERAALGFKAVPEDLKTRTNANEGSLEAQRTLLRSMEAERTRINLQYDNERQRLALLLAGLPPGPRWRPAHHPPPPAEPPRPHHASFHPDRPGGRDPGRHAAWAGPTDYRCPAPHTLRAAFTPRMPSSPSTARTTRCVGCATPGKPASRMPSRA